MRASDRDRDSMGKDENRTDGSRERENRKEKQGKRDEKRTG